VRQVLDEARQHFDNVFVARDFDRYRVVKQEPVQLVDEQGNPMQHRPRRQGGRARPRNNRFPDQFAPRHSPWYTLPSSALGALLLRTLLVARLMAWLRPTACPV
jgi:hypothetical protein